MSSLLIGWVWSGIMSIVLFPVNILLHILHMRFPPIKVHDVDLYILFLEIALLSISPVNLWFDLDKMANCGVFLKINRHYISF